MKTLYLFVFLIVAALIFLVVFFSSSPRISTNVHNTACSNTESLNHIYHPDRLEVLGKCETVSGTVDLVRIEADGDVHIQLHVDGQYANLLNDSNMKYQHGDLVLEVICAYAPSQQDAKGSCAGYVNKVYIPQTGEHVVVSGQYVADLDHSGWAELHPVYSVTIN